MKKFEPLREDPCFQAVLKDMNLSQCVLPKIDLNRILAKLSLASLPLVKPYLQLLRALQILQLLPYRPPICYCGIATA